MTLFSQKIIEFAKKFKYPIYAVGGFVRNYLVSGMISEDIDLASSISADELVLRLKENGFNVLSTYKRTGTIVFSDGENRYEYTSFRTESYLKGGTHLPQSVSFTDDIYKDALRRDFKCNAVYMNISTGEIVDPLGGVLDIKNRVLDTTKSPREVFSNDGLRLLRLARFMGELAFTPTLQVIEGAKEYKDNIKDVSSERILDELKKILVSDTKYSFSDKRGHYNGLKLLEEIGVLEIILPELYLGKGIEQRKDFHNYDVLEHSLRTVLYADKSIRLTALIHDIGKPSIYVKTGKFFGHEIEGEIVAKSVLKRLKLDNKSIDISLRLIRFHMLDLDGKMGEVKIKKFIAKNLDILDKLLLLKQADFSACKDDLSLCSTVKKWKEIYAKMVKENTPFSIKDLKISAKELIELGFAKLDIKNEQQRLLNLAIEDSSLNEKERLINIAKRDFVCKTKSKNIDS